MAAVLLTVAVLVTASLVAAQPADASELAQVVRALAENVLGRGAIRSLTVADGNAMVLLRWESATYRPDLQQARARDLLYFEAELATGSILGRLPNVTRVRFSILAGAQLIATGQNTRATGVQLRFAPALGGGTYVRPQSDDTRKPKIGGQAEAMQ